MRFAVCNELFRDLPFLKQCQVIRNYGLDGIEIAPFTIGDEQGVISDAMVGYIKSILLGEGVSFAGLHWLLTCPSGYSLVSEDISVRKKSVDYLKYLSDISNELGGGELTLGCPKQRMVAASVSHDVAFQYFCDSMKELSDYFGSDPKSVLCIEPLTKAQTNMLNSFSEVEDVLEMLPKCCGISSMLDFHNTADENLPVGKLVEIYRPIIRHVHVNDMEGGCPTFDDFSKEAFYSLCETGYQGWVSLEIFDDDDWNRVLERYSSYVNDVLRFIETI